MKPKIYDCFMFFNEHEILEIRMDVMNDFVDYFVLVESTHTHTGTPKPLHFNNNKDNFDTSKIIHIIVDDSPLDKNPWVNERFQRNCISRGLINAQQEDIIIVSDVDEIPNPNVVMEHLECLETNELFSLKQKIFYYYLNCLKSLSWGSPTVSKFKNMSSPQDMRRRRNKNTRGEDGEGGWHYSYIGGIDNIKLKLNSFAHQEFNTENFTNDAHIKKCLQTGEDLYNRTDELLEQKFVSIEGNSPDCIQKYIKKYPYLVKTDV